MDHQRNINNITESDSRNSKYPAHTYRGVNTSAISFPLGGLGTGCIGLSGSGRLAEWEIFNKPNKGGVNGFSHFAIKAESGGKVLDTRVLNNDLPLSSYQGGISGHGPGRTAMAGMPHFRDAEFTGTYPLAFIRFIEPDFPGRITMKAFNPFIPLDDKNSGIPAAFFELEAENPTEQNIEYTFYLSVSNPSLKPCAANRFIESGGKRMITLSSGIPDKDNPEWGEITFAADSISTDLSGAEADAECSYTIKPSVTGTALKSYTSADHIGILYQEYWYRGNWFDSLGCYWRDISAPGPLKNRSYPLESDPGKKPKPSGRNDTATLAVVVIAAPGQSAKARFIISWNYPNFVNYWDPDKSTPLTWKNYYARLFHSSEESALYGLDNWDSLYRKTEAFRDALFSSTLPSEALDAVSSNISILKTPTCLRLEDGSFYAFEGCNSSGGCCPGSCTHVWNYAYALPFLFPKLERSMRDLDYSYNQREDGSMSFRLRLPPGRERSAFRACADGQFGGVIKVYREWKISGDDDWLRGKWEAVRKSLDFAWAPSNEDHWDEDRDGVLEGRQHHTLDMELFGPNSWLTGMYLAALKAGAAMADFMGEKDKAAEYGDLFKKGCEWTEKNLFNGEYYFQKIDLSDRSILSRYDTGATLHGESAYDAYWNDEAGEIKYQIGEGCIIDQVLAQWHANLCGLGRIFEGGHVRKALESIYKYNFKKSMRSFYNPCRLYSMDDEAGTVICEWPEGHRKPVTPVPYAEETMCGFEYQAGIHMIQEGLAEKGMELISAVRSRFDGHKRNPWNEFECGSNYGRSMASYALLNAFSGFMFDTRINMLGFDPVVINTKSNENGIPSGKNTAPSGSRDMASTGHGLNTGSKIFRCFWCLEGGYGVFEHSTAHSSAAMATAIVKLSVIDGHFPLKILKLPFIGKGRIKSIKSGDKILHSWVQDRDGALVLDSRPIVLSPGCGLEIIYS